MLTIYILNSVSGPKLLSSPSLYLWISLHQKGHSGILMQSNLISPIQSNISWMSLVKGNNKKGTRWYMEKLCNQRQTAGDIMFFLWKYSRFHLTISPGMPGSPWKQQQTAFSQSMKYILTTSEWGIEFSYPLSARTWGSGSPRSSRQPRNTICSRGPLLY